MKSNYSLNLTYKFKRSIDNIVSQTTWHVNFKRLHVKSEGVSCLSYLSFQEEYLSIGWYGNLDSSMVYSARLEIRGSNPGPGSSFSLENLTCKFYKAWNL